MAKGKVVQVIGTVVDVEFPPEQLPALYNAIEIPRPDGRLVLEAESHPQTDHRLRHRGAGFPAGVGAATAHRVWTISGGRHHH